MKPQENTATAEQDGAGCVSGIGMVLVFLACPLLLVSAAATNALLKRRWPDRALAWVLITTMSVATIVLLGATNYVSSWLAVVVGWTGHWRPPTWQDWALVLSLGLLYGPAAGAIWWRCVLANREQHPYSGEDTRKTRLQVEERRRRRMTHRVQRLAHTGPPPVRTALRPLCVPLGDKQGPFLGRYQRGTLGGAERAVHRRPEDREWRSRRLVRLPITSGTVRHVVLLGATGMGKTESTFRLCEWALKANWKVVYISAKEPPSPEDAAAPRLVALADSLSLQHRVLEQHWSPFDPMRGHPDDVRDRFVKVEDWGDRYYQHYANLLLSLALDLSAANGDDIRTLPELVYSLTTTRLAGLARRYQDDSRVIELVEGLDKQTISGALIRYASVAVHLRDWIGSAGGWSWEDADLCVAELPTGRRPEAGAMLLRLMVRDFGAFLTDPERRPIPELGHQRRILFVIEEAGQVANDPVIGGEFVNLIERGRTAGAVALLTAQDPLGLGDDRTQSALFTNGTIVTYRQITQAQAFAEVSGARRVDEGSQGYDPDGMAHGAGGSKRRQYAYGLDPDHLRQLAPGELAVLHGGKFATAAAAMASSAYGLPASEARDALVERMRRPAPSAAPVAGVPTQPEPEPDERPAGDDWRPPKWDDEQ